MRDIFLRRMVAGVPELLNTFDPATGRFMTPGYEGLDMGWAVTNQDVLYPLALLTTTEHADNPYYGSASLWDIIQKAGDAVRDWQYPDGQVEFIKVDGSKWGPIYMPWTMYHWVEAYALIRDALEAARRARWEEGLQLAFDGIANNLRASNYHVHNIPTWDGMSLVRAGQVFGRDDWGAVGREMIRHAVAAQTPEGYWEEHGGPTTLYNAVYVHAIGLYSAFTEDASVRDCLRRGLDFHLTFTYPNGACVETVDGRVKYHPNVIDRALTAYSFFPDGRRFVRWLMARAEEASETASCAPYMASAFQHFSEGDEAPIPQEQAHYTRTLGEKARVVKQDAWFTCLSALVVAPTESRWGMDRQNFLSLYHQDCGLIVGGGNSKDQSAWSNFVVGETYLPQSAHLLEDGVALDYGAARCTAHVRCAEREAIVTYRLESGADAQPVTGHLLLHILPDQPLTLATGTTVSLQDAPIKLTGREAGGWLAHNGWRLQLPDDVLFEYPVSPFNPYAKEGNAPLEQAVGVVSASLNAQTPERAFLLRVDAAS